jgi:hypothetical protein
MGVKVQKTVKEVEPLEYKPKGVGGICPCKSRVVDEIIERLERQDCERDKESAPTVATPSHCH